MLKHSFAVVVFFVIAVVIVFVVVLATLPAPYLDPAPSCRSALGSVA